VLSREIGKYQDRLWTSSFFVFAANFIPTPYEGWPFEVSGLLARFAVF
jgi:hypothetical protein